MIKTLEGGGALTLKKTGKRRKTFWVSPDNGRWVVDGGNFLNHDGKGGVGMLLVIMCTTSSSQTK